MVFWNEKINVSKEAAKRQVEIVNSFPSEKRMKIALDFANLGVEQTRTWIKKNTPAFSELEITLEFVRLLYYENGDMQEEAWTVYRKVMEKRIRKDWSDRFRKMMRDNNWDYDHIAKLGQFKNGKVIEATVSRGLPAFAKLAVVVHEQHRQDGNNSLED